MRFAVISLLAATAALAVPQNPRVPIEDLELGPANSCEYLHISWTGGVPPYTIAIGNGDVSKGQRKSIGHKLDEFESHELFGAWRIKTDSQHLAVQVTDQHGRKAFSETVDVTSAITSCLKEDDGAPSFLA